MALGSLNYNLFLMILFLVIGTLAKKERIVKGSTGTLLTVELACKPNTHLAKGVGCRSSKYFQCTNSTGKWRLEEKRCGEDCCFHSKRRKCVCRRDAKDEGVKVGSTKMLPVENLFLLDNLRLPTEEELRLKAARFRAKMAKQAIQDKGSRLAKIK